jgi:mannose-6-phosphate isomerase-like protein (cupin superfamily)
MYNILKMIYAFVSMAPRTATFTLVLSRDGPVSNFSLHVHEHLPSALWVVSSGSSVMVYMSSSAPRT